MSELFSTNLEQLKARFGRSIPPNVLHYFLKENNGDINKCVEDLERNQWFKRRHTSDVEPAKVVDTYKSSNLSSSQGSAELKSQLHHSPNPVRMRRDNPSDYPDVFHPHPPLLPNAYSNDRQQTNDMPHPLPHPTNMPRTDISPSKSMPVQVPFTGQMPAKLPGYTKQLSEADKETILKYQRESSWDAKMRRENVVAQLQKLKKEVGQRNEELRKLKRENSSARIPQDDDLQLTQIIIDTLKMDIQEEEQKRKSRDWSCRHCNFINTGILSICEMCKAPRPIPVLPPRPLSHQPPDHTSNFPSAAGGSSSQYTSPAIQGYKYR